MGGDSDTRSGRRLLSKMVQFVTRPTTPWSRLDEAFDDPGGARTQARLKGLIERKKQDDAVRTRELDMLRGLLNNHAPDAATDRLVPASEQAARAAAERARTLKKIDELDAQMTSLGPCVRPPVARPESAAAERRAATDAGVADDRTGGCNGVEEAAIHFANGDTADAEAALRRVLDGPGAGDGASGAQPWRMLFDLYRLTQQRDRFNELGDCFAQRFQQAAPQWPRVAAPEAAGNGALPASPAARVDAADWRAPARLDEAAWAQAEPLLAPDADGGAQPADWGDLEQLAPQALPALATALQRWATCAARLSWRGVDSLLHVLAVQTVLYDSDVDASWWRARLALLQLLDQPLAFDEVALGFCMTYEVAPPRWQAPACTVERPDDPDALLAAASTVAADSAFTPTVFMADAAMDSADDGVYRMALDGELAGNADALLERLVLPAGTQFVECGCRQLRRVDFGAASSLYNWVMQQQGRGCHIIFVDVNHLVAAFLEVIGMGDVTAVIRAED